MANKIQLRRDTAANWTTANPILTQGEPGVELDTNKWKIGNGTSTWAVLQYQGAQLPTNNAGYLYNNGSGTLSWGSVQAGGTVTNVGMDMGSTGLTVSTSTITTSGTFHITGTLAIHHGGTGANTAHAALNNLLPTQAGHTGSVLTTDGNSATWQVMSYTLPTASTATLGGVLVDGTTIVASTAGVISSTYTLPTANTSTLGGVIVDGTTIVASTSGVISSTFTLPSQTGNSGTFLSTNGVTTSWQAVPQYQLTAATTSTLGGVIVDGATILIDANGVIRSVGGGSTGTTGITSVGMNMGTTGLTVDPALLSAAGAFAFSGTLSVLHGGTGASTATDALVNLGAYPATNPAGYTSNTGSVTSVSLNVPTGLTVSGSPITSHGTLTLGVSLNGIVAASSNTFTTVVVGNGLLYNSGTLSNTLAQRDVVSGTTTALAPATTASLDIIGAQNYVLYKLQTSDAAWVTLYVNAASRTADASRPQGLDPEPNSGVVAEVITTGSQTVLISPGVFGFNDEATPTSNIPLAVRNTGANTASIVVTLTILKL